MGAAAYPGTGGQPLVRGLEPCALQVFLLLWPGAFCSLSAVGVRVQAPQGPFPGLRPIYPMLNSNPA